MRHRFLLPALAAVLLPATSVVAQVAFDSNIGTGLGAGNDTISAANALGFNFTMPDGSVVTAI
ncbi:MAG: hypothetical protein KDB80_01835, partial [Planctomycetes bacterium]|nr:hypothetical protein [Planctomycetota bacterium]